MDRGSNVNALSLCKLSEFSPAVVKASLIEVLGPGINSLVTTSPACVGLLSGPKVHDFISICTVLVVCERGAWSVSLSLGY